MKTHLFLVQRWSEGAPGKLSNVPRPPRSCGLWDEQPPITSPSPTQRPQRPAARSASEQAHPIGRPAYPANTGLWLGHATCQDLRKAQATPLTLSVRGMAGALLLPCHSGLQGSVGASTEHHAWQSARRKELACQELDFSQWRETQLNLYKLNI